ncbi:MAG: hypothetical protein R3A47_00030 [Polyangiales bacterium]
MDTDLKPRQVVPRSTSKSSDRAVLSAPPRSSALLLGEQSGVAYTEYVAVLSLVALPVGLAIYSLWGVLYNAFSFTKFLIVLPIP